MIRGSVDTITNIATKRKQQRLHRKMNTTSAYANEPLLQCKYMSSCQHYGHGLTVCKHEKQ